MIEKQIVNEKILPTDVLPVIHFSFAQYKNPRNTFGIVHFIKDVQKALNKFWGLMIQDFQMRSALRMIVPKGAISDPQTFEKDLAKPGSVTTYEADMNLPNGGKPEPIDMGVTSQMFPQIIALLVQLAEYITGIFGVMQGNSEGAPSTFGATQQLAGFGTQRIKLISRAIESPMSKLAYVLVRFLQWTVTPEKVVGLICNGEEDAAEFIDQFQKIGIDTKFKVRMQITSSLPTSTQMAANMFSILAGQVPDPQLQRLLIEYSVKFLELKEADEIISKMDIIKEMQGQLEQMQMSNQNLESQLKAASNNLAQKDIAMIAEKAKNDIKANAEIEMAKQSADMKVQAMEQQQAQVEVPQESNKRTMF